MTRKKLSAIIFAIFLAMIMLFSPSFIITEKDHDCSGENCEICQTIAIVGENVKALSFLGKSVAKLLATVFAVLFAIILIGAKLLPLTLINLKVKLSF